MIPINTQFNYPSLDKITQPDGKRHYIDPEGNSLSSVTTILGETADKTGLDEWRKRVGNVEADRISKEATGLGTLMHTHLENYTVGLARPAGTNVVHNMARKMADVVIENGLRYVDEIWGIESMLYYSGLYAGSTDICGVHKGSAAIMDYKTSRKPKKSEYVEDYRLQITAYALAHNKMFGTDIRKGVIMIATRDAEYQEFVIERDEFDHYAREWTKRVSQYYSR